MKINQLRCFVQLADSGSVRAAADHIGVSPTAVSQALRELERSVGAALFLRQTQGMALTYVGRQFLTHARLILGQVERAEEEMSQLQGAGSALSIGVTPWISQSILPRVLTEFQCTWPNVRLDIYEALGSGHTALREGALDLVIGMPPRRQHASSFISTELFSCELAVVARPGHPLAHCTSLRDLIDQSWLLTLRHDTVLEQSLLELLQPYGFVPSPHKIHFARSTLISFAMLEGSDMLTVCPWPLVESRMFRDRFHALPIRDALPAMKTSLIMRRSDTPTNVAQAFIDCFLVTARACFQSSDPILKRVLSSVEFLDTAR